MTNIIALIGVSYNLAPEIDYSLLPDDIQAVRLVETDLSSLTPATCQIYLTPQRRKRGFRLVRNIGVSLFPNVSLGLCR